MKPVIVKQTKDQIADIIREDILSGVLKGGDELTQEQIAEQTGLSRMPVREALQTLEQEGFLNRLPNRHMRVIEITNENIRQYYASLTALELSFCRQLFEERRNIQDIEALIKQELASNSPAGEYGVHAALSTSLGNEYLGNMHCKWLRGFYLYSLEKYFKPGAAAGSLRFILEGIMNTELGTVSKGMNDYFKHYEKFMIKESEPR